MDPATGALGSALEEFAAIESNPLIKRPHSISREKFIEVLRAMRSPAADEAEALADIPGRYGIDRGIALAFFVHESSAGKAGVVRDYGTRNWGNLRRLQHPSRGEVIKVSAEKGKFAKYVSWSAGLEDWCELMSKLYVEQWKITTLGEILRKYAPKADQNDPEAYARKVVKHIQTWQIEMRKGGAKPHHHPQPNADPKPPVSPAPAQPLPRAPWKVTVTAEHGLRIRQGRGTDFPVVALIPCGEQVLVGDETDGWLWLCDGRGFIAKAFTHEG